MASPTVPTAAKPARAWRVRAPRWLPVITGALFALIYATRAAPGIVAFFDDTLEFQLVLPTAGIAHPTGYPLYTLLGFVWSRLLFPFGEWAWRVNVLSALCAGAAVGLICALAQRLARAQGAGAWLQMAAGGAAALAFGLGPTWWAQATVAEVYALHLLLVALILWLALAVADAQAASPARLARAVAWLGLACGLGLTHHRTTVLLFPALAVYLLWAVPALRRPGRLWAIGAAALLAPLLLYLYIPLRAAQGVRDLNGSYVPGWQGFWDHVLARRYGAFFAANPLAVTRTPGDWLHLAASEMGWMVAALGALGLLIGLARHSPARPAWALITLAAAANLAFALLYRVGDVEVFLLPLWLGLALGLGGLAAQAPAADVGNVAYAAAALLVALLGLGGRAPLHSRADDWAAHDGALALSAPHFPHGSQVLGLEGEMTALRYMQLAHGRARSATPVMANDPAARRTLLDAAIAAGTPVYLTRELPGIEAAYSFSGDGALVRVWPRGQAAPAPPLTPLTVDFAQGALRLVGYDLAPLDGAQGRVAALTLDWLPQRPMTQTFKVSLRVVDETGTPLLLASGAPAQQDLFPLRMVAPTSAWPPGQTVRDAYQIALPPGWQRAHLQLILYDSATVAEAGRWEVGW